jgi:hypothetical protein
MGNIQQVNTYNHMYLTRSYKQNIYLLNPFMSCNREGLYRLDPTE